MSKNPGGYPWGFMNHYFLEFYMAKAPLPSLGTSGWITEIAEKADKLMSYFLASDASQSVLYAGSVSSLQSCIQIAGNSEVLLEEEVTSALSRMLNNYFDGVEITVEATEPDDSSDNRFDLSIDVIVFQDDQKYSLGSLIRLVNSSVAEIIKVNNG